MDEIKKSVEKLTILNVEMPEFEPTCASRLEDLIIQNAKLQMVKRDLKALSLLQAELPEFNTDEIKSDVKAIEDCLNKKANLASIMKLHGEMKPKLDTILADEKTLAKARDVLVKTFKVEHADVICPHRNDIYADECLEKFSK